MIQELRCISVLISAQLICALDDFTNSLSHEILVCLGVNTVVNSQPKELEGGLNSCTVEWVWVGGKCIIKA